MPAERSSLVVLKRMKEFDNHTKKTCGGSMSILREKISSRNVYPEHDDEPSKADSGEMENIYVPYEGCEYGNGDLTVPEAIYIKYYDLYMEA